MVNAIGRGSETDRCVAGFGKVRVYEGRAKDGGGGCWGSDDVAGVADWVVGEEHDGSDIGGDGCGWMSVSWVLLLLLTAQSVRDRVDELV